MQDLGQADPDGVAARLEAAARGQALGQALGQRLCFHYLRPTFGKLFSASFADEETEAQHNHLPKGRGLDRAHVFLTPSHPTVLQTACPWP